MNTPADILHTSDLTRKPTIVPGGRWRRDAEKLGKWPGRLADVLVQAGSGQGFAWRGSHGFAWSGSPTALWRAIADRAPNAIGRHSFRAAWAALTGAGMVARDSGAWRCFEVEMDVRMQDEQPRTPVVYFIRAQSGPIRIGFSGDCLRRLNALRSASPVPLELVCSIPGDHELERSLKKLFRAHRKHSDWFEAAPVLAWLSESGHLAGPDPVRPSNTGPNRTKPDQTGPNRTKPDRMPIRNADARMPAGARLLGSSSSDQDLVGPEKSEPTAHAHALHEASQDGENREVTKRPSRRNVFAPTRRSRPAPTPSGLDQPPTEPPRRDGPGPKWNRRFRKLVQDVEQRWGHQVSYRFQMQNGTWATLQQASKLASDELWDRMVSTMLAKHQNPGAIALYLAKMISRTLEEEERHQDREDRADAVLSRKITAEPRRRPAQQQRGIVPTLRRRVAAAQKKCNSVASDGKSERGDGPPAGDAARKDEGLHAGRPRARPDGIPGYPPQADINPRDPGHCRQPVRPDRPGPEGAELELDDAGEGVPVQPSVPGEGHGERLDTRGTLLPPVPDLGLDRGGGDGA